MGNFSRSFEVCIGQCFGFSTTHFRFYLRVYDLLSNRQRYLNEKKQKKSNYLKVMRMRKNVPAHTRPVLRTKDHFPSDISTRLFADKQTLSMRAIVLSRSVYLDAGRLQIILGTVSAIAVRIDLLMYIRIGRLSAKLYIFIFCRSISALLLSSN